MSEERPRRDRSPRKPLSLGVFLVGILVVMAVFGLWPKIPEKPSEKPAPVTSPTDNQITTAIVLLGTLTGIAIACGFPENPDRDAALAYLGSLPKGVRREELIEAFTKTTGSGASIMRDPGHLNEFCATTARKDIEQAAGARALLLKLARP